MHIARPPGGFTVSFSPNVLDMVRAEMALRPEFGRHWGDIVERLRFTAHREGKPESRLGKGFRLFVAAGVPSEGRARVVVGYRALGDSVHVTLIRISS